MAFQSMEEIIKEVNRSGKTMAQVIRKADCKENGISEEDSLTKMEHMWNTMYQASCAYEGELRSKSGFVGGDGDRMKKYVDTNDSYAGDFDGNVIAEAIKMGESNACMKQIVASPTAGSCGVIPAVLIVSYKKFGFSKEEIVNSLYVAAGIGQVISHRASLAGAAGGCQAEIGSASAMAAGALVYLKKGTAEQIAHGVAMALKNMLGLVCDPVAGLVEIPCVKRNVAGAMNAIAAADMALAHVESRIPVDQVIDAMREIGDAMPMQYKETACGGCAATEWAKQAEENMRANRE